MIVRRFASLLALLMSTVLAPGQTLRPRLSSPISSTERVSIPGSRPAFARRGLDLGALSSSTELRSVTLVFRRTTEQQAAIDALSAAQNDPGSSLYHQWITPEQFAARFGVADADLNKVEDWLRAQGFAVIGVSRSRNSISFNGTEAQIASALGTELHRYHVDGEDRFAPAGDVTLPADLAPLVLAVQHLSDLHPHSHLRAIPRPHLTSGMTGNEFLTPSDVATMYDVKPVYSAGFNGAGQTIAVLGQSYTDLSAVAAFQAGANLPSNTPTLVLVPQTGVPGVNSFGDGDEEESQLDLEYSSGMAPGAKILLVYTGDAQNAGGTFTSLAYAIDQDLAPILSGSYGLCESELQTSTGAPSQDALAIQAEVQQANLQGQTVIFSSGDDGSTDCYGYSDLSVTQQGSPAVDFPGSVPYVTAVGGLQMQAGTYFKAGTSASTATSSQYWQSATGSDVISSLLSYVPETVWNESVLDGTSLELSSGGGGASVLFGRPSWQAGIPGISSGSTRLTPDVSLQASTGSPGYVLCTTDPSALLSYGETASCTNGLRSPSGDFIPAGGTSFAAPIMAGLVAVLNQAKGAVGQGDLNPTLYGLAANSATYASVFHDITTGNNACPTGTANLAVPCAAAAQTSYTAGTGYDLASGLGSFDFAKLVAAWPVPAGQPATAIASVTTLTAATLTPASGATDAVTISVAGAGSASGATPTGSVSLEVDGSSSPVTLNLTSGQATYTYMGTTVAGTHTIVATYSGDSNYLPSKGTLALTLSGSTSVSGSFTLTAGNISLPYNGQSAGTITLVPASGYSGTVSFSLSIPSSAPTICYSTASTLNGASNLSANSGQSGPPTATLTLYEGTQCGSASLSGHVQPGTHGVPRLGGFPGGWVLAPAGVAMAGLLAFPLTMRRRRRLPWLLSVILLTTFAFGCTALSGCGGSSSTTTGGGGSTNPTQSVIVTLTGTDTLNSSVSSSTTLTVTVHQ